MTEPIRETNKITYDEATDTLSCACGNRTDTDGFVSCDENGLEMEPLVALGWNGRYRCQTCGARIIVGQGVTIPNEQGEPHYIDCTPVGLQTQEGIKRVNKAVERFHASGHAVANLAVNLLRELVEAGHCNIPAEFDEEWAEYSKAVESREAAQDEFMRAVAGAPPAAR